MPFGQTLAPGGHDERRGDGQPVRRPRRRPPRTRCRPRSTMYDPLGQRRTRSATTSPTTGTPTPGRSGVSGRERHDAADTTPAAVTGQLRPGAGATLGPIIAGDRPRRSPSTPAATYPTWTGPVTVDLVRRDPVRRRQTTAIAQRPSTAAARRMGTLQSFSLGNDGTITGVYSNGLRQPIGQLALANVRQPQRPGEGRATAPTPVGDNSGAPQHRHRPAPAAAAP